jgi:hypothetical protein
MIVAFSVDNSTEPVEMELERFGIFGTLQTHTANERTSISEPFLAAASA